MLVFLEPSGIWNLRGANLESWYLGQELYISVVNLEEDRSDNMVLPLPDNTIFCALDPTEENSRIGDYVPVLWSLTDCGVSWTRHVIIF